MALTRSEPLRSPSNSTTPWDAYTRDVPLPATVRDQLAAHLVTYPAVDVSLPWREPSGELATSRLILSSRERLALNRNYVNTLWKRALVACAVESTRQNGSHALRHFYASTLLDAGESIKALSEYLGGPC